MNNKSALLSRRRYLQGTGVALALPWFETFALGKPNANDTPKRFVSVYHPDGVGLPLKKDPAWKDWSWFPRGGEKDFHCAQALISPAVELSSPSAGTLPSMTGSRRLASCLPYSTPHWSNGLMFQMTLSTKTLCS